MATKKKTTTETAKPKKASSAKTVKKVSKSGAAQPAGEYVVLARRYRPQQFDEVIGQDAVARALGGAIEAGRVAHAYLFTGSRGVGKTSMARILAKALNCAQGPAARPCDQCDICRAIISGDDVDVLEIDGASNRGIDEIRELRQNVGFRPSRTRYKIYIIDEVHMLTREAFNALLKTLEEPPPHVKFIFCTTEAHKIPITILSRCQRFDFGAVPTEAIVECLQQVVDGEGAEAEPEALEAIAARAAGSMRDSQSLLDQVLAFGGKKITAEQIHQLLGTASEERVAELGEHLLGRRPGPALAAMQAAVGGGVQVEQLLDQLIAYFRDLMIVRYADTGAPMDGISVRRRDRLAAQSQQGPLGNLLAAMQVLIEAKTRMRGSNYAATLTELALVRVATMEDLQDVAELAGRLGSIALADPSGATPDGARPAPPTTSQPPVSSGPPSAAQKKTPQLTAPAPAEAAPSAEPIEDATGSSPPAQVVDGMAGTADPAPRPLQPEQLPDLWRAALARCDDGFLREQASRAERFTVGDANQLVVFFDAEYTFSMSYCVRPERMAAIEAALAEVAGQPVKVRCEVCRVDPARQPQSNVAPSSYKQRLAESAQEPLVRKVQELFQATIVRVDDVPGASG